LDSLGDYKYIIDPGFLANLTTIRELYPDMVLVINSSNIMQCKSLRLANFNLLTIFQLIGIDKLDQKINLTEPMT
jgi:hypothetical protein